MEASPGRRACANPACSPLPALYALDHNVERLAEDHANARRLAEMLGNVAGIRIMNPEVETNIVFIDPIAERHEAQGYRRRVGCATACAWAPPTAA